jgi:hypothetical protein
MKKRALINVFYIVLTFVSVYLFSCSKRVGKEISDKDQKTSIINVVSETTEEISVSSENHELEILVEDTVPTNVFINNYFFIESNILKKYYGTEKNIIIPDGIEIIGDRSFLYNIIVESVYIPYGVITIGDGAFGGCVNLKNITIPDSVKTIKAGAFSQCKSLKKINLPSGLTDINAYVFSGSGLYEIIIPEGVERIMYLPFKDCVDLTTVIFPNTLTAIGDGAFWGCINLKNIIIPLNINDIGCGAFYEVDPNEIIFENELLKSDIIFESFDYR